MTEAPLLPDHARLPAAAAILLSSLFHVADMESKTEEGYFVGFPARSGISSCSICSCSVYQPMSSLAVVASLVLATFVPLLAVHPFRVVRLRRLTCLITLLWAGAAGAAIANPFPSPLWVQLLLVATALYLAGLGIDPAARRAPTSTLDQATGLPAKLRIQHRTPPFARLLTRPPTACSTG